MSHEHRRDHEDGEVLHQRKTDVDKVARYGESIERWFKLAWPLIALLWGIFMATVWQPLRSIPELHEEVAKLAAQAKVAASIDSVSIADRAELRRGQAITNRILCFNLNRDDRIKYDIDCNGIPLPEK